MRRSKTRKTGEQKPCSFEGCKGTMDLCVEITSATPKMGVQFEPPAKTIKYWRCRTNVAHQEMVP